MNSPNNVKEKHKPRPSPIDKIKLRNKTACSAKADYYTNKINRHKEMAAYHDDMSEQGIHPDYHKDKARHHHDQVAKLTEKISKDIGPVGSISSATGAF